MSPFQLFENTAVNNPDQIFIIQEIDGQISRQFTYEDFYKIVIKLAATFTNLDIAYRDRLAIILPRNLFPEAIATWLAANALGAIGVMFEATINSEQQDQKLHLIKPKLIVNDSNINAFSNNSAVQINWRQPRPSDIVSLIFDSKNNDQLKAVIQTNKMYLMAGESFPFWLSLNKNDRLYECLPPSDVNFQAYSLIGVMTLGATIIIGSEFQNGLYFWKKICATEATIISASRNTLEDLNNQPAYSEERLHHARIITTNQPIADAKTYQQLEDRFGLRIVVGYNSNENLFGFITPLNDSKKENNIVGLKKLHPRLAERLFLRTLIYEDKMMVTKPGETGELALLSPATTPGYWENLELTKRKRWGDWWLTGDLFTFDEDGYLHWIGRNKRE